MISFENTEHAETLAQAIMNTLPEPFLVLDDRLRVLAASVAFYRTFEVDPDETIGCLLYALGHGQWDIPGLRLLLETMVIPPFLTGSLSRIYAAMFSFCLGVMPPMAILGRSLLYVHSQRVA
jgi:PAS domain-containing protein